MPRQDENLIGPSHDDRRKGYSIALELSNGRIGYVVVPEFRRLGYATTILRLSVQIAREKFGIGRI